MSTKKAADDEKKRSSSTTQRTARKRRIVEVTVSDETRERIDRLTIETGWTRSKIVEEALSLYESERARAKDLAKRLGFSSE